MNGRRASMSTRRGWLLKRGGLFKSKFQKRYFILRGNELQRYQNDKLAAEGPSKAKALIKMEGVADVRPAENENGKLQFFDTLTNLTSNNKEIILYKIFQIHKKVKKYYMLTNIGILIAHLINDNNYEITDLFLETTPGRLIFSFNFTNALKI